MQLIRDRLKSASAYSRTHLDERITKRRCSNITDPHTSECRDAHQHEQDNARFLACCIEDSRSCHDVQSGFGEDGGDGETTDEEHDCWREHLRKDVPDCQLASPLKPQAYLVASAAGIRVSLPSVDRSTRRRTTRKGTANEVTNRGIAYTLA
jgi:hypothetical protein